MIKKVQANHKNLNGGKPTDIYHCMPDDEFKNQFFEIFVDEQYKKGRRKKNAVYVDYGANIGMAYLYFKDYAKKYYAYEPNPEIFECLRLNTQGYKNIEIFNKGISYQDGLETMYKIGDSPAQMMVSETVPIGKIDVTCVSSETVFKDIPHCDVLKIDVEGFEYAILPSMAFERVVSKIDFIIGESHFMGPLGMPPFIPKILKDYGFETTFLPVENMTRTLTYTELTEPDKIKRYEVLFPTMFYAQRPIDKKGMGV